jgi:hypothetical protein
MQVLQPLLALGIALAAPAVSTLGLAQAGDDIASPGMPPTPEQMAARLKDVPRCAPNEVPTARSAGERSISRAEQAAEALRQFQQQFPDTTCNEGDVQ